MTAKSNYLENALINHVLRNTAYTSPTTVYAALFLTNPGESGSGTEVSGGSYARQSVTFTAPVDGLVSNVSEIVWPTATAAWGTVAYFALLDAVGGGNMLYYGLLTTPAVVGIGDAVALPAGNLIVQEL